MGTATGAQVRRDSGVAGHPPTIEPSKDDLGTWLGDAKLSGTAAEIIPHPR
jgi:hypothetical protein